MQKFLISVSFVFLTLNTFSQTNNRFPFSSFDKIIVYERNFDEIHKFDKDRILWYLEPDCILDAKGNLKSKFFKKKIELNRKQRNELIKIINNKSNYVIGDCSTIWTDAGFAFYKGNKFLGIVEVSYDCYELLFFHFKKDVQTGHFKESCEYKLLDFLKEIDLLK